MEPSQYPAVIFNFEQEIRTNLSAFVDSIRDFFVDLDKRIRSLGEVIAEDVYQREEFAPRKRLNTIASNNRSFSRNILNENSLGKMNQNNFDPIPMFSERIALLETNLKKTQENEGRLLSIVEKLSKKSQQQQLESRQYPLV